MACDINKTSDVSGKFPYYCNNHRCYSDLPVCRYDESRKLFNFFEYAEQQLDAFGEVFCVNGEELWKLPTFLATHRNEFYHTTEFRHGGIYLKKVK